MRFKLFAMTLLASWLVSAPPIMAEEHDHVRGMHQGHALSSGLIDGMVKKLDRKRSKITLKHGEIKQIQMPPMVMNYQVTDVLKLDGIQPGDKVRFSMDKVGEQYVITHIERVR